MMNRFPKVLLTLLLTLLLALSLSGCDLMVGTGHRVGTVEVDLVLSGTALVVAAFGLDVHGGQCQADLTAHILPVILPPSVVPN